MVPEGTMRQGQQLEKYRDFDPRSLLLGVRVFRRVDPSSRRSRRNHAFSPEPSLAS